GPARARCRAGHLGRGRRIAARPPGLLPHGARLRRPAERRGPTSWQRRRPLAHPQRPRGRGAPRGPGPGAARPLGRGERRPAGGGDMRAGRAGMVGAARGVQATTRLRGDLLVQSVVDEEPTGNGTLSAVLRGYRADGAVVGEPTSMGLVPAHEGSIWFRISVA